MTCGAAMVFHLFGINRNIVECKDIRFLSYSICSSGINRNIVECKERSGYVTITATFVLIETLWNVKIIVISV